MMLKESLIVVQTALRAPKNQRNDFGKYNYRSAEDILEAVKPLLRDAGITLTITDEIKEIGGRIYVEATCRAEQGDETITTKAYAREPDTKKGMDDSQITGTASSYARKYALNGMFLIDDNKDPDTNEYQRQTKKEQPKQEPKEQPILCPVCGNEVKPRKAKTGETLTPEQVLEACGGMCQTCYILKKQEDKING